MKLHYLFYFIFTFNLYAQIDSLKVTNERYYEDQLYVLLTYNVMNNQSNFISDSGFSYGFSLGYIRDIPLTKRGNWAIGVGTGYNYDSYNHGVYATNVNNIIADASKGNKLRLHQIEFPLQIRWRTSTLKTYNFWRVYLGGRLSYNFSNLFLSDNYKVYNINAYNKLQIGLEISMGYGSFNFYSYYSFSPLYNNLFIDNQEVDISIIKSGIIFYFL